MLVHMSNHEVEFVVSCFAWKCLTQVFSCGMELWQLSQRKSNFSGAIRKHTGASSVLETTRAVLRHTQF